jgi:hypothetical protein
VAAITLSNTVYLERSIAALRQQCAIDDSLIPHVASLGWNQINLMGNYVWHANKRVATGRFPAVACREIDQAPVLAYEKIRFLRFDDAGLRPVWLHWQAKYQVSNSACPAWGRSRNSTWKSARRAKLVNLDNNRSASMKWTKLHDLLAANAELNNLSTR